MRTSRLMHFDKMSTIMIVTLILLIFLIKTIYCNRTMDIQMINDYVNQDILKSTTLVAHLCWEPDEKYELLKLVFANNHTISVARSSDQIVQDFNSAHTILHILDLECKNTWDFLSQANEHKLLSAPYKWLLLLDNPDILDERLPHFTNYDIYPSSNIVIAQKAEDNEFHLSEIYRYSPSRKELVRRRIANWTVENKFRDFKPRILARERQNLNGTLIPIGMVILNNDSLNHLEDFRFTHIDSVSKENYIFAIHVLDFMKATRKVIPVDTWGYNNHTGLVGDLAKGVTEIAASVLYITHERIPFIDFASKTSRTTLSFLFRQPPLSYESNLFTLPFTRSLWISCFCLVLLATVLLYLTVYWEWRNPDLEASDTALRADFMEVVMLQIGGVAQQGATHEPRSGSGKIVMIFSYIALMFLYVSYSANIVALLQSSATNIRTLEDLLASKIKLGIHDMPYNVYYFKTANDPIRKAIYEQKIAPPGQKLRMFTLEEGIRRIRAGFFAFHLEVGPGYKVISDTFLENEKCNLQEMSFLSTVDTFAPMRKYSSYKEILRIGYRRILESGLQSRVNKRIYADKPKCEGAGGSYVSVGLIDCYPAFLVFGVGVGLSIGLLIVEKIASKTCKCFHTEKNILYN